MANLQERIRRILVPIPTPAAGAEIVITPTTLGHWRILNLRFELVTSAVVGNRTISAQVDDGTTVAWEMTSPAPQAAGATIAYQLTHGIDAAAISNDLVQIAMPWEGVFLRKGWTFTTTTTGIDVADQYSAISAYVEELPDGPIAEYWPYLPTYAVELDA